MTRYDFDFILENYLGSSGKWQYKQFIYLLLQNMASTVAFMLPMYSAFEPPHRCFVPSCDYQQSQFNESWVEFSIPQNDKGDDFLKTGQEFSSCQMFKSIYNYTQDVYNSTCDAENFLNFTQECEDYVYDKSIFEETLVTKLDLVCDESYKIELLGTILMAGLSLGCLIGGPLGDKIGRKKTLILANVFLSPSIILGGFIANYKAYAFFRFINCTSTSIIWINAHALLIELFGKSRRKLFLVLNSGFFTISGLILPLVVYFERDWKFMHLWLGLIALIALPFLIFLSQESIRWMVLNDRKNEAEEIVYKIAKENCKNLSVEDKNDIDNILNVMAESSKTTHQKELSPLKMFSHQYICQSLIVMLLWITSVISFYALHLNATNLAGNIFVNYILATITDFPAALYIFFCLDTIGRKKSSILSMIILGITCTAMAFISKEKSKLILALYMLGKLSAGASLSLAWIYTAELYPTNLRAQSIATFSLISRLVGMISPFVVKLGTIWDPLPMLVLGTPCILSGLLIFLLPETSGKDLIEVTNDNPTHNDPLELDEFIKESEDSTTKPSSNT